MILLPMINELVAPVKLFVADCAREFGLLYVKLHMGHKIVLVLEPAAAYLALVLGGLAAFDVEVSGQTRCSHVDAVTARTFEIALGEASERLSAGYHFVDPE